jgi:hypothetical protein
MPGPALPGRNCVSPASSSASSSDVGQVSAIWLELLVAVLWYNGAWFAGNTTHWKGYPSVTDPGDRYTPVMWSGWVGNMTTILALAELRPARA